VSQSRPNTHDIETVLRLGAGTPSTDPRRRHALKLVRACNSEPPPEWFAEILAPAAWHLVADALSAAPAGTVVEHGDHAGGQHQDIIIWHADERWPRIFITWTSGTLHSDNDSRALDRDYAQGFIGNRAALTRSVLGRFNGAVPGAAEASVAAAHLIAHLTEPPFGRTLLPCPGRRQTWCLDDPDGAPRFVVDLASGCVSLPDGAIADAARVLSDLATAR
jgi:hypothetical protein